MSYCLCSLECLGENYFGLIGQNLVVGDCLGLERIFDVNFENLCGVLPPNFIAPEVLHSIRRDFVYAADLTTR